jgi:hypothetical protein
MLLETIFTAHGDALYQAALLLEPQERAAVRLLHALAADLVAHPPLTPPNDVALVARLVVLAQTRAAKRKRQPRSPAETPVLRSLHSQPIAPRMALSLHLLFGYEPARIAEALAVAPRLAAQLLEQAMRAIAPVVGSDIPDRVSGEHCPAVRVALIDPTSRERQSGAVRSHLATCSACRAFDQRWHEVAQAVETVLRQELRPRQLPRDLYAKLVSYGAPRSRDWRPYRLVIPLAVVLVLIAALVLPGFTQRSVTVVDRSSDPVAVDPSALIAQALELHTQPPQTGPAIWRVRFETLWYFDERTFAPLHADLWLDRNNPARHRAQITHRDGGAPYELQLGNGTDRLYYGLDASYAPVIYSGLNTRALAERPRLSTANAPPAEQAAALRERLTVGPWGIAPFYLTQAHTATDLRVLGRQRDGDRTVQIVSFAAISPLAIPSDPPERVTVLLALDSVDGRLRRATELLGPAGGTQVSRVTWNLIEEEQFAGDQPEQRAFSIDRAWNGLGDFGTVPLQPLADPALPFLSQALVLDPAWLIGQSVLPVWMPGTSPPDTDRAYFFADQPPNFTTQMPVELEPQTLIYLGPERRLSIRYGRNQPLDGEQIDLGLWEVTLRAEPGNLFRAFVRGRPAVTGNPMADLRLTQLFIEAQGYDRDTLLALITDLQPLTIDLLLAQDAVFAPATRLDRASRTTLLQLLGAVSRIPVGEATYWRWRVSQYQPPAALPPSDPYSPHPLSNRPAVDLLEAWLGNAPDEGMIRVIRQPAQPGDSGPTLQYTSNLRNWFYDGYTDSALISTFVVDAALVPRLPRPFHLAFDPITEPGWTSTLRTEADGSQTLTAQIAIRDASSYFYRTTLDADNPQSLVDVAIEQIRLELRLESRQTLRTVTVFGVSAGGEQVLLAAYELEEQAEVLLAELPEVLLSELPPPSSLVRNFDGLPMPDAPIERTDISAVLPTAPFPIYLLPSSVAEAREIESNFQVIGLGYRFPFNRGGDELRDLLEAGLAARVTYVLPPTETETSEAIRILHGPADPIRAFLRSTNLPFWRDPQPLTIRVAGRNVTGWVSVVAGNFHIIAEQDGQIFLIAGRTAAFERTLPLLAELAPFAE